MNRLILYFLTVITLLVFVCPASALEISLIDTDKINQLGQSRAVLVFGEKTVVLHEQDLKASFVTSLARGVAPDELYIVGDRRPVLRRVGYQSMFSMAGLHVARVIQPGKLQNKTDLLLIPIKGDMILFEKRTHTEIEPNPLVEQIIAQIDQDRYEDRFSEIINSALTRYTCTDQHILVKELLSTYFLSLGYQTEEKSFFTPCFSCDNAQGTSVIATKPGLTNPEEIIFVSAHYDSTSGASCTDAPGANDNGSGTAGIMELAEVFSEINTERTIVFIAFDGEELGLIGSIAMALNWLFDGTLKNVKGFVNLDMISWYSSTQGVIIEGSGRNTEQEAAMLQLSDFALTYTDLDVTSTFIYWGSDHVPFLIGGAPGALLIESEWNLDSNYHTTGDVIENQDMEFATKIVKIAAAALAEWAYVIEGDDDDDDYDDDDDNDNDDNDDDDDDDDDTEPSQDLADDDDDENGCCG